MGLPKAGKFARILLDTFVQSQNRIYREVIVQAGLLQDDEPFKEWRRRMIKLGILEFQIKTGPSGTKYSSYNAGRKIIDLVNKELMNKKPLSTASATNSLLDSVNTMQVEINLLKSIIKTLVEFTGASIPDDLRIKIGIEPTGLYKDLSLFRNNMQTETIEDIKNSMEDYDIDDSDIYQHLDEEDIN